MKLLFFSILSISALEIIVYQPLLMPSHVRFMAHLVDVLVDFGHNVTVLVSEHRPDVAHGCGRAKELITVTPSESVLTNMSPDIGWKTTATPYSQWTAMKPLGLALGKQCKNVLNDPVLHELRERKFDVLIHEVFDMCGLALLLALNVEKHVIVSSTRQMDTVGYELGLLSPIRDSGILSDYGSYLPWTGVYRNSQFIKSFLKFTEIQQTFYSTELRSLNYSGDLRPLVRRSSAVFLNTHPLVDTWRPSLRNVYDIGGIGLQQPAPLDTNLSSLMSKWEKIVLISFGTVVPSSHMPSQWKNNLKKVIRSFPSILFMWKYEAEDDFFNETHENIIFSPFFPQNDLLGSGKISFFITHGGQNSVLEAANAGVPMVVVPQFGDQFRNAKAVEERKLGKVIMKSDLGSFETMHRVIQEMLDHKVVYPSVAGAICVESASREFVFRLEAAVRSPLTFEGDPPLKDILVMLDQTWTATCVLLFLALIPFAAVFLRCSSSLFRRHFLQEKLEQS